MRPLTLTLTLLIVILLSSCTRYEYVTVDSPDIKKNDNQEFVVENDSVRMRYSFRGENAPINLTIENKLDVPVYVDWRQSSLILNDRAVSYEARTLPIEATINASVYHSRSGFSVAGGTVDGFAKLPPDMEFIPPHAFITSNPMGVTNQFLSDVPDTAFLKVTVPSSENSPVMVKRAEFNTANSPLRFESYLTLIFGDQKSKPVPFEQSFYVSEVYSSPRRPADFWYGDSFRGDQFFLKRTSGFGRGFGIVGGIALLSTVDALNASLEDHASRDKQH